MRVLKYKVQGQNIVRDSGCDFSHIIKGSNNYIRLVFEWDEQWKNKAKVISFRNVDGEEINVVLQAHTSQDTWTPPDAPSLFAKVLIPDSSTIPEWEQPESTNPYSKGDKVTHNGKTWQSTTDNNVWEPGVYGWEEV